MKNRRREALAAERRGRLLIIRAGVNYSNPPMHQRAKPRGLALSSLNTETISIPRTTISSNQQQNHLNQSRPRTHTPTYPPTYIHLCLGRVAICIFRFLKTSGILHGNLNTLVCTSIGVSMQNSRCIGHFTAQHRLFIQPCLVCCHDTLHVYKRSSASSESTRC